MVFFLSRRKAQIALVISLVLNVIFLVTSTVYITLYYSSKQSSIIEEDESVVRTNYGFYEQYIEPDFDSGDVIESNLMTCYVLTASLNVRLAPDQASEKIGVLTQGQKILVTQFVDSWAEVLYNDQVGYVKSEFLAEVQKTP